MVFYFDGVIGVGAALQVAAPDMSYDTSQVKILVSCHLHLRNGTKQMKSRISCHLMDDSHYSPTTKKPQLPGQGVLWQPNYINPLFFISSIVLYPTMFRKLFGLENGGE